MFLAFSYLIPLTSGAVFTFSIHVLLDRPIVLFLLPHSFCFRNFFNQSHMFHSLHEFQPSWSLSYCLLFILSLLVFPCILVNGFHLCSVKFTFLPFCYCECWFHNSFNTFRLHVICFLTFTYVLYSILELPDLLSLLFIIYSRYPSLSTCSMHSICAPYAYKYVLVFVEFILIIFFNCSFNALTFSSKGRD